MSNGHVSRDAALVFARFDVRNDFLMCHRSHILGPQFDERISHERYMQPVPFLYEINNY